MGLLFFTIVLALAFIGLYAVVALMIHYAFKILWP